MPTSLRSLLKSRVLQALLFVILALGLLPTSPIRAALDTWVWSPTGSMNTARQGHTATLLPDGTVLAAGGYQSGYLTSAELYHPVTGQWSATGSMNMARSQHTATLLLNGKVLVTGGFAPKPLTADAEIYDPLAKTWSITGSPLDARVYHTATLLIDGRVLVTGGQNAISGVRLANAELYDPTTGRWSPAAHMKTARWKHTATLLANGKVLVTGGDWNEDIYPAPPAANAEVYDPATGLWTDTGAPSIIRLNATATRLADGRVLVAGGTKFITRAVATAEVYNPSTGTWSGTGNLQYSRDEQTAALLLNGKVLVTGPVWDSSPYPGPNTLTSELYDPATGRWSLAGVSTMRMGFASARLVDGTVLLAGGTNGVAGQSFASAELYGPAKEILFFPIIGR